MKFTGDTKDAVIFLFGCVGIATFGVVMPLYSLATGGTLAEGFNLQLFGAWAAVAGIGHFGGMGKKDKSNGSNT